MYPNTTNRYLFLDREPEYSIIQLSSQLFGIPSVASRLLSEQAVGSMIIAILYGFFTDQLNRKTKTLVYPPNISNTVANPESPMFKHKRYTYAFADFNRLIGSPEGRKAAVENSSLQDYFASFCAIFHGFNPMTRMLGRHVEYENEAWVGAFNLSMHLAKSTRALGTCFQNSGNDRAFLERTARLFKKLAECTPCRSHYLTFAGVTHQIVDYKVSREAVSFHYPLTWYLAEILKCIDRLDPETMKAACNSDQCLSFRDWVLTGFAGQYPFLTAIEPAVRGERV